MVAFMLQNLLTDAQLLSWGWRLPFWSGIIVSLSGFYLRSSESADHSGQSAIIRTQSTTSETNDSTVSQEEEENVFHDEEEKQADWVVLSGNSNTNRDETTNALDDDQSAPPPHPSNPIKLAFARENLRSLLAATMVPMLWSAGFYLSFIWLATYMKELSNHTIDKSFAINAFALLLAVCIFFPVAGHISDQLGRKRTMTIGGVSMGLLSPVLIWVVGRGNALAALGAQLTMGVSLSLYGAPMCSWLVESFDPEARLTSVAIGYNLAQAIAGGSSPALATLLVDHVSVNAPGWMLTTLATIALLGLHCVAPARNSPSSARSSRRFTPVNQDSDLERKNEVTLTSEDHEVL